MKENTKQKFANYTEEQLRSEIRESWKGFKGMADNQAETNLEKFVENDNQAAGTRARGALQEMIKMAKAMRLAIQQIKKLRENKRNKK